MYNHGSFLHKFRADKDVCVVLGREQKQCDVCVDEEGVASQHAAIVHSVDGPVLMDIGGGETVLAIIHCSSVLSGNTSSVLCDNTLLSAQ